jgi:phage shock protein A
MERSIQDLADRADRAEYALNKLQQLETRIAELEKKVASLSATQAVAPAASAITGASGSESAVSAEETEAAQAAGIRDAEAIREIYRKLNDQTKKMVDSYVTDIKLMSKKIVEEARKAGIDIGEYTIEGITVFPSNAVPAVVPNANIPVNPA